MSLENCVSFMGRIDPEEEGLGFSQPGDGSRGHDNQGWR